MDGIYGMKSKALWITQTAAMLALLIGLQWAGSMIPQPMVKQLVTGTCVNCVLAVTVLTAGWRSGITVAAISPVCAFLLGIAPNLIAVIPIMFGNALYITQLYMILADRTTPFWRKPYALITAALAKFGVMNFLIAEVICGMLKDRLLGQTLGDTVILTEGMLKKLPAMFSWPQLVTALTGGMLALLIVPLLKKTGKNSG